MRTRWRTWIGAVALLAVAWLVGLAAHAYQRRFVGTTHEFPLPEPAMFLTEPAALAVAQKTLARDVPDSAAWFARPDGRTVAPDGRRDEFLSRNSLNPNHGSIRFNDATGRDRFVSVELVGDRLVCRGSWGK